MPSAKAKEEAEVSLVSLHNKSVKNFLAEPTVCPGYMCPEKWDACDTCPLNEESIDTHKDKERSKPMLAMPSAELRFMQRIKSQ
ncbi:MAG: hypothetical protein ACYCZZ_00345 [Minisyncoccota bacterium]